MKKTLFLLLLAAASLTAFAQQRVSIIGDSYSTYGGHVRPQTNLCWYNGADKRSAVNDVTDLEQMWWYLLAQDCGLVIDTNNSYSGSTICLTGYRGDDYSDRAFITRVNDIGTPDIILIFGGTNDSWAGAPIGEYSHGAHAKADLYSFRPAFDYLLDRLTVLYPDARIINITNSGLKDEVTQSMADICKVYGVDNVVLHDIDKQSGHPSIAGMRSIADQVAAVLNK